MNPIYIYIYIYIERERERDGGLSFRFKIFTLNDWLVVLFHDASNILCHLRPK